MAVIGIDLGSTATKGILIDNGQQYESLLPTGWSPRDTAEVTITQLLSYSGLHTSQVQRLYATGYGRVAIAGADQTITEIKCQARGIHSLYPDVGTIIDIGGQDSKVIRVGPAGQVLDFAMNDKCAAGTGRFLQVMATALGMDVSELGSSEDLTQNTTISSMCTVFAESEIIGLLARGTPKGGIIAGLHHSVARRVASLARRLGIKDQVAFTGGVAANTGMQRALQKELGLELIVPSRCFYTGALGAALLAQESLSSN